MKENEEINQERVNIISSNNQSSNEISSGTEESFFEEEDKNLIEKVAHNKTDILKNKISFTNKFELLKSSNFLYHFYCENINVILLMNIFSIILFLFVFVVKLIFKIFFNLVNLSDFSIILISILLIPFLFCTLIKMITIYKNLKSNKNDDNENKDLETLIIQKWNIYYSISLFLLTINFVMKLMLIDVFYYRYKIILILNLPIIFLSLSLFGLIYYLTKSSNNIIITNLIDNIAFPLSISVLFSFIIIIFVEQIKLLIYNSLLYTFILTCVSLVLMSYYNDILFAIFIFLYQLGGIKSISFYNMNFNTFCALVNLVFIIFITIKSIRKHFFTQPDDNSYVLVVEEASETNDDESSDEQ